MPVSSEGEELQTSRQRILSLIRATPGISVSDLARRCKLSWLTVHAHVGRLQREGLIASRLVGRRKVLFMLDTFDAARSVGFGLLAEHSCWKVASTIAASPGTDVPSIAMATGLTQRAVYHHLARLIQAHLVTPRGRRSMEDLRATETLTTALREIELRRAPPYS